RGTGVERRPREVNVRIPAGVRDGQRIRLKGRGDPGRNGGPAGDLYVTCRVAPHSLFRMDGRNLKLTVPVTFAEAALGATVEVPTIDGGTVKLRVPEGTPSGRTMRVKGRGVVTPKATGDLLVTVEVAVPAKLSPAEREAIEALAAAATESPREHLRTDG
ncbi:MAG: molecular chaperone DnaJ, partial [Acidimicrobiales bacterium]|nr:molecular chaperone DnaJ [Acidimicrobiales bacterium]